MWLARGCQEHEPRAHALLQEPDRACDLVRLLVVRHLSTHAEGEYHTSKGVRARAEREREGATHVVHLVRHELEPVLTRLDAGDHRSEARADDGLRGERAAERGALGRPLEALLDDAALRGDARADDHPALVVEVAEDDLHAAADGAERVRDGRARAVKGHVGRARGGRVRGLDRLGRERVLPLDEDDGVPLGRLRRDGEVVGEGAVRDPPARRADRSVLYVRGWGEAYFLVPVMTHSSPSRSAYVCNPPTSLPAKASLMARQMNFLPSSTSGTTLACSSGEPKLSTGGRPMTWPARRPSTYPRVPRRPISKLTMSCGGAGRHVVIPGERTGATDLVEVVELLGRDYAAHELAPL